MPSSSWLGSRRRSSMIRSYSSRVKATSRSTASSTRADAVSSAIRPLADHARTGLSCGEDALRALDNAAEDGEAVFRAEQVLAAALGVRHHSQDIALLVDDPGDVVDRPIGIGCGIDFSIRTAVAEYDPLLVLQPDDGGGIGKVVALAVRHRNLQHLSLATLTREGRCGVLDTDESRVAAELQVLVADQRPGEEVRLAQDLKAVADADHLSPTTGELRDRGHHRREAGDGAAAQVVAVGETTGQDDAVQAGEVTLLVPDESRILAQAGLHGIVAVALGPCSRKDDYAERCHWQVRQNSLEHPSRI